MIYILIYLLFIIGTIYSIPKVKDKINKSIGLYLYKVAGKFYDCILPIKYETVHFDAEIVEAQEIISESQVRELVQIYGEECIDDAIKHNIELTKRKLFDCINEHDLIDTVVDKYYDGTPAIRIRVCIRVGKRK